MMRIPLLATLLTIALFCSIPATSRSQAVGYTTQQTIAQGSSAMIYAQGNVVCAVQPSYIVTGEPSLSATIETGPSASGPWSPASLRDENGNAIANPATTLGTVYIFNCPLNANYVNIVAGGGAGSIAYNFVASANDTAMKTAFVGMYSDGSVAQSINQLNNAPNGWVKLAVPASSNVPGSPYLRGGQCNLSGNFGAYGDDVHDDSPALNAALAAWQAGECNTIVLDAGKTYLIDEAIEPYFDPTTLLMKPLRITSDGPNWNGAAYSTGLGTGALDLRYNGSDGLHPAKIDLRGVGYFEFDHATLEDKGTDDFLFLQTTNTTVNFNDYSVIGDPTESGSTNRQDFAAFGSEGTWDSDVTITSGSTTLTNGGSDPAFTTADVGKTIYVMNAAGNNSVFGGTIAAYVSPTQVTLSSPATVSLSGTSANYFGVGTGGALDAYQGYGSTFTNGQFAHIARVDIYNNFANGVTSRDEYIGYTSGCSASYVPNCAPFYFGRTSSLNVSNRIMGDSVEARNYPYAVAMNQFAIGNTFQIGYVGDGTLQNFGAIYSGSATNADNTITMGFFSPVGDNANIATTIPSSFGSGVQTVTPASMTGINTTTPILIDPDSSGVQEWVTPSATTSTTFTATFAYAHAAGVRVLGIAPYISGIGYQQNTLISNLPRTPTLLPDSPVLGGIAPNITTTTVNGPLVLPNIRTSSSGINDGGSVSAIVGASPYLAFGSLGVTPNDILDYGIGLSGDYARLGAYSSGSQAGVSCNLFSVFVQPTGAGFCGDTSGNFGVNNNIVAGAKIQGRITQSCVATGGGVPCFFDWSCTMSAGSCTYPIAVPASRCSVSFGVSPVISTTDVAVVWASGPTSGTITVHVQDQLGTATSTFSGVGTCL